MLSLDMQFENRSIEGNIELRSVICQPAPSTNIEMSLGL